VPAVTVGSFTDWIRATEVCVAGARLAPEDDAVFSSFGK
jgi:hypothetical protein